MHSIRIHRTVIQLIYPLCQCSDADGGGGGGGGGRGGTLILNRKGNDPPCQRLGADRAMCTWGWGEVGVGGRGAEVGPGEGGGGLGRPHKAIDVLTTKMRFPLV